MRLTTLALCALVGSAPAFAAPSGGDFNTFIKAMKTEAAGLTEAEANQFFDALPPDPKVLQADRNQGVFRKPFTEFARSLISQNRIDAGRANAAKHANIFARAQADYGIPQGILLAFWAFETDFGSY
ncbi:Transglycosylase SLT domain-containing protein [Pseudorhodobacter antarcticus]|jgi:membrane-bound lytic murein transglycosylase B|uniref:Transglycosylase SLT domain-containing protein n=1 Tax=Pseudorhodobacter antarcticus TaxID=1077947 RepID=A0A1H8ABP7_9RHOB|nr:Transglycosylase SLT domain-containing protein [Pseudorhodobacter antarcticus]